MASQADNPETSGHPRILRLKEVMHRTGDSRSSIYRLDKKGILRRAKHLAGSHTAGWLEDSVDAYIESRRPDAIPGRFDTGLAKASKVHTLIRPQEIGRASCRERV